MNATWTRRIIFIAVAVLIVGAAAYALRPAPVPVDMAEIDRGRLVVTIKEEGIAQITDVFQISAPIAGKLMRSPVKVGDSVMRNQTPVASIVPADPPFLDVRSRREIEAAVEAARAAVGLAEAQLRGAEATARLRAADLERAEQLDVGQTISRQTLDRTIAALDTANAQVEQAAANLRLRNSEFMRAEAALIEPDQNDNLSLRDQCCLTVRSPVDGVVLSVPATSEQVVAAGMPLLEIGNPHDMEVVVHLLSSDAVQIDEGASARLYDWGGEGDLSAQVTRVDPAAYTKVSALGIEEQRVNAVLEILDPPDMWNGLGHDFRVMVAISLWEADDAVRVPMGALFRRGDKWNVFRVVDGRAEAVDVDLGHRNDAHAEVRGGLEEGDTVILHPNDRVAQGVRVAAREDT